MRRKSPTLATVDASVVAKWYLPEIGATEAQALLDWDCRFVAPDLLPSELGNIVWKKQCRREITSAEGRALLADMLLCDVSLAPCKDVADLAHEIATALGISFYDSLYAATAVAYDAPLVTADTRLAKAMGRAEALSAHVMLLP